MCWLGICDARLWEGGKSLDRSGVMVGEWGGGWGGECWAGGRAGEGCEELCLGLGAFETFKRYVRGRVQALLERSELRGGPGSPPPSSQGCWRDGMDCYALGECVEWEDKSLSKEAWPNLDRGWAERGARERRTRGNGMRKHREREVWATEYFSGVRCCLCIWQLPLSESVKPDPCDF